MTTPVRLEPRRDFRTNAHRRRAREGNELPKAMSRI